MLDLSPIDVVPQSPGLPIAPSKLGGKADRAVLERKAVDFEAVFITQMLQPMFDTVGTDGAFQGGRAESFWRSLELEEFGKAIANQGGIGLAPSVLNELVSLQAKSSGGNTNEQ